MNRLISGLGCNFPEALGALGALFGVLSFLSEFVRQGAQTKWVVVHLREGRRGEVCSKEGNAYGATRNFSQERARERRSNPNGARRGGVLVGAS